ncbi:S8 family serine peptidase [Sutcliffiella horikoshii]|uniref:S8 family serine peptidase n=1 Tax=Sutcliffiella horikoshii TaxID=79883 RepID=A0A5D4T393_9BACI|nr:S8 family peptidase [Sutcliffiella horikoshii]TYS69108.1 S8 family serine peptidase [Sutcliffiella horikoshii]
MSRKNKRNFARVFSIIMCLLLIAPSFNFGTASAQGTKASVSLGESKEVMASKITDRLSTQFSKDGEKVTFLIKFKEQVDTQAVAAKAVKAAKVQKASAGQEKLMKRNAVVSELRATSIETQANVKEYLEKAVAEGKAKDIQSFYVVNGMAVTATKEVMEELARFPEIEKLLPNEVRQLDPSAEAAATTEIEVEEKPAANLENIEWGVAQIGAPQAWEMGVDGQGTVVASIDTGVQWDHPALMEKYRGYNGGSADHEYNWFDATPANQSTPYDDDGHGTHVTGTMVGAEPNGSNQIGVAPGAKWIGVKAFTPSGGTDVALLAAGEWILAPKDASGTPNPAMAPDVVNNSWGGGPGLDEWYRPMVQAWVAADIFPAFAAGNTRIGNPGGPGSVSTPGNYPESFATGATDVNMNLASFSLQGPSPYDEIKPEVSAPGVGIRSSFPGSEYGAASGTSMASPHVAGVVALLKQVNSSLTVADIEEILMTTATARTDSNFPDSPNNGYGHGIINAFDAVSSIISGLGKIKGQVAKDGEDSEAPTFEHTAPAETYAGMSLPLSIHVQDNVSISSVTLQYQNTAGDWVDLAAERASGSYNDATYTASIPGDDIGEPSVSYRFHIVDFGGNEVTSDTYEVSVQPGISVGYSTDFETDPVGWYSFGAENTWQWGVPSAGPAEANSGEKVYGTNLEGNYGNRANMTLVMPPIDLPEDSGAYLQFMNWFNLETRYDFGHVFVSTDQENWTQLLRFDGISESWTAREVDLSAYAGQRIYIGFNVTTDGSVVRTGWYIDDVALSAESNATESASTQLEVTKEEKVEVKEEQVNPDKIHPVATPEKEEAVKEDVNPAALPLHAQVTVLETNRSVNTNPANGQYEMLHAAGTFTVEAAAYGYHPAQQTVDIPADGEAVANFVLDEIAQGTVTGTVTNSATGEPVANATLMLVEDAAIAPVTTDENGNFSITAYEGDYTLRVMAPSYYSENVEISIEGDATTELDIELRPFIGYPGEIGYDDGTAENARAFYDAGNGWAVKMSLPEGQNSALVTGGLFRFWDTTWPTPGGTDFKVEVWDASGTDGAPGSKLAGPFDGTALRTGEWTTVDLAAHGIIVEQDFYMVYIQSQPNPNAPGLGTDEDGPNAGRSWQYVGGAWSPAPEEEGNYMIRALVNFEVTPPTITSPADGTFTNESTVTVEGNASPTTTVHVMNNGEEVATATASEEGTFAVDIELANGENVLTAKSSTETGVTEESAPVTVVLDKAKPELAITSPEDGSKTNRETVTVTGTVADENLDFVKVNGKKASVEDGTYSLRVMLENGENNIRVVAQDLAGNRKRQDVTVYANYDAPEITNLKPEEDKHLSAGESVKIEFNSAEGLRATFSIRMPLTNASMMMQGNDVNYNLNNAVELPLMEQSPGYYVGYWTATSSVVASGAEIEVKVSDDFGNVTRAIADGKLFINEGNDGSKKDKKKKKKN